MATAKEHYKSVLSDVYSWMYGGFEHNIQHYCAFFKEHNLGRRGSGIAIDLGAGCGFQSIPLAQAGYTVTAIDIDSKLLEELRENAGDLDITAIQGDLIDFDEDLEAAPELIVCMTDTVLHLESKERVRSLFNKICNALEEGGNFVMTFRDMSFELEEIDRFLPVRSDENLIFTCFLEYESETVKVHDIVYSKSDDGWILSKSFYRKLRLPETWVSEELSQAGFSKIDSSAEKGLITIIAQK